LLYWLKRSGTSRKVTPGFDKIGSAWHSSICDDLLALAWREVALSVIADSRSAQSRALDGVGMDQATVPDLRMAMSKGHPQPVQVAVQSLAGDMDPTGVVLMRLVRVIAHQYDALEEDRLRASEVSGPRWGLLLHLLAEERRAGPIGTSPTYLSRCQNVSKNTISSLLRGLEEQGLVERTLDADDKRVFRMRLTTAGRELVQRTAPAHILFLNELAAELSVADRAALVSLLEKLHRSLRRAEREKPTGSA
jgi:DNA-binding MarR family transcriptional regulator